MALLRLDHIPQTTKVNQQVFLIIPEPNQTAEKSLQDRKVIYLLHGLGDDASCWQRYSIVETLAWHYGFIAVMPSVDRSFYTDLPNGRAYFTYLTQELPQYLKQVFQLAPQRKDTCIAGLSMGGYGAIKAALLHPELYQAAASFSGLVSFENIEMLMSDPRFEEFKTIFGDTAHLKGGVHDPGSWVHSAAKSGQALPELYVSCGRQDYLYSFNQCFRASCAEANIPVHYYEEDNDHNWIFWDDQLRRFIRTLYDGTVFEGSKPPAYQ